MQFKKKEKINSSFNFSFYLFLFYYVIFLFFYIFLKEFNEKILKSKLKTEINLKLT